MEHSTDRILTAHCGGLAGPKDVLDQMKAKVNGSAEYRVEPAQPIDSVR